LESGKLKFLTKEWNSDYPAAQETTRSRIGIPTSASAMEAALIHVALVPAKSIRTPQKSILFLKLRLIMSNTSKHDRNKLTPSIIVYPHTFLVNFLNIYINLAFHILNCYTYP
jgi:hypothetical protein